MGRIYAWELLMEGSPDAAAQWKEMQIDQLQSSALEPDLSRRLNTGSSVCECATECANSEDDDVAVEISEKAVIGIAVGLVLGPFALGVLALQVYRLRHTRHY